MGVPIISEANKNKELLLEIDSIVPDTNGHHLADISLSSNDSLSRSRRRWKLIKIISKMNPSFEGRSKKLIFYQSLSAILSIILTGIFIYWLAHYKSTPNSSELSPSSSFLVSSRSSSSTASTSPPSPSLQSPPSPKPESPTITTLEWEGNFDSSDYDSSRLQDNPALRLMATLNDTDNDGEVVLKISDSPANESNEGKDDRNGGEGDSVEIFPPFPPFQPFPQDWFETPIGGPMFLPPFLPTPPPPPPSFFQPPPPHSPPFQMIGPFDLEEDSPTPIDGSFSEHFTPSTFNLDKIKSSAQEFHAKAIQTMDDLMRKLKDSSLADFLSTVNTDDLKPELIIRSEDDDQDAFNDDDTEETMVGFNDTDDTVDNFINFLKKIVF